MAALFLSPSQRIQTYALIPFLSLTLSPSLNLRSVPGFCLIYGRLAVQSAPGLRCIKGPSVVPLVRHPCFSVFYLHLSILAFKIQIVLSFTYFFLYYHPFCTTFCSSESYHSLLAADQPPNPFLSLLLPSASTLHRTAHISGPNNVRSKIICIPSCLPTLHVDH